MLLVGVLAGAVDFLALLHLHVGAAVVAAQVRKCR